MDAASDPGFNLEKHNEAAINSSKYILDREPLGKAALVQDSQAPCLYSLPKLHKNGHPIRFVVSYISSPLISSPSTCILGSKRLQSFSHNFP